MFWGWGREDDELFQRMKEAGMSVSKSSQHHLRGLRKCTVLLDLYNAQSPDGHPAQKCLCAVRLNITNTLFYEYKV